MASASSLVRRAASRPRAPARCFLDMPLAEAGALLRGRGGSEAARKAWRVLRTGEAPSLSAGNGEEVDWFPGHALSASVGSECGTSKLLLQLHDGLSVETVLIPFGKERGRKDLPTGPAKSTTICVSSQVGCAMACRFCATGAMGRRRGLSTGEILAQVFEGAAVAQERGLPPIRNVVFMGQGEPLDNADAVEGALAALVDQGRFGLAPRRITVSTVGPSPEAIMRMEAWPARLAWSVHAADDALRKQLVPSARFSAVALRDAFVEALAARGATERESASDGKSGQSSASSFRGRTSTSLYVEATLIDGVNDAPSHAEQMIELLAPLPAGSKVNLIPYNRNTGLRGEWAASFQPSPPQRVEAYRAMLIQAGFFASTRAQRGAEDAAACGMLTTASRGGRGQSHRG